MDRFLWASLVLEEICEYSTDETIIEILQKPPLKLEKLFEQILLSVLTNRKYRYMKNMLMWTLGAERELSLAEMCQALSVEAGQHRIMPSRSPTDITSSIASTRGLVCLDEDDAKIRVVHHSSRKYLLSASKVGELTEFTFDTANVQIELAHVCMTFLNFDVFTSSLAKLTTTEQAAVVALQLAGAAKNALEGESKTALSILKARKHPRQLSARSPSPSHETTIRDIERRLGERITRMTETTRKEESLQTGYAFLAYAKTFWYQHASSLTPQASNSAWVLFRTAISFPASTLRTAMVRTRF